MKLIIGSAQSSSQLKKVPNFTNTNSSSKKIAATSDVHDKKRAEALKRVIQHAEKLDW